MRPCKRRKFHEPSRKDIYFFSCPLDGKKSRSWAEALAVFIFLHPGLKAGAIEENAGLNVRTAEAILNIEEWRSP